MYVHASYFRASKPASRKNSDFRDSIGLSDCHILNGNKFVCKARNPSSTFKYHSIVQGLLMGASGARSQQYGSYRCGGSGTEDNGEGIVWRIFI